MHKLDENFINKTIITKKQIKKFFLSIVWLTLSILIAHNIYSIRGYEISGFFISFLGNICNFVTVVLLGEEHLIPELIFSWWVIPFCLAWYWIVKSGIKVLVTFGDLFLQNEEKRRDKNDLKSRILAKYSTYDEFREEFEGFSQLSKKAKKEIRNMF